MSINDVSFIDDLIHKYPQCKTIHEIALSVVKSRDFRSLNLLLDNESYLPIRWDDLINYSDSYTLRSIYGKLSTYGKALVAMKLDDMSLLDTKDKNTYIKEAAIQTKYLPVLNTYKDDPITIIRGFPIEYVIDFINDNKYMDYTHLSIKYGRTDVFDYILSSYGLYPIQLEFQTITYLPPLNILKYILIKEIDIPYVNDMLWVINDDPTMMNMESFSISGIHKIIYYDAIECFKKISLSDIVLKYLSILNIGPKISRYLIHTDIQSFKYMGEYTFTVSLSLVLTYLGSKNAPIDALNIYDSYSNNKRLILLRTMAHKGYIELLDRFLDDRIYVLTPSIQVPEDILILFDHTIINKDTIEYRDYRFSDRTIIPSESIYASIINKNMSTLKNIHIYDIPASNMELINDRFNIIDPKIHYIIESMIK